MVDLGNINTISLQGIDLGSLGVDLDGLSPDVLKQIGTDLAANMMDELKDNIKGLKMEYTSTLDDTSGLNDEAIFSITEGTGSVTDAEFSTALDNSLTAALLKNGITVDDNTFTSDNFETNNLSKTEQALLSKAESANDPNIDKLVSTVINDDTLGPEIDNIALKLLDGKTLTDVELAKLDGLGKDTQELFLSAAVDEIERADGGKIRNKKPGEGLTNPAPPPPPPPPAPKKNPKPKSSPSSSSPAKEPAKEEKQRFTMTKTEVKDAITTMEFKDAMAQSMFGGKSYNNLSETEQGKVDEEVDKYADHVIETLSNAGVLKSSEGEMVGFEYNGSSELRDLVNMGSMYGDEYDYDLCKKMETEIKGLFPDS